MEARRKITLTLETSLDGGSIALFENEELIDTLTGSDGISRSEDVIRLVDELLKKNNISKKELEKIVVSDGPGSITGLRNGQSIVKGLGSALKIKIVKKSVLQSAALYSGKIGRIGVFVYTQKGAFFYYGEFLVDETRQISIVADVQQIKLKYIKSRIEEVFDQLDLLVFSENTTNIFEEFLTRKKLENNGKFLLLKINPAQLLVMNCNSCE